MASRLRHELDRSAPDLVTTRGRRLGQVAGLAAAALYVIVVAIQPRGTAPVRLLFDGFAPPQPYRWVSPPPRFAASNQPPQAASGSIPLTATGSESVSLATGDGQAYLIAAEGAFASRPGERSVLITITPHNPSRFGPPPDGVALDGNAYTFQATLRPSGEAAALTKPASVVLRYPIHATELLRWNRGAWVRLETIQVLASLEVFANTTSLGTFVPAAPRSANPHIWILYFSIGAIAVAAVAGLIARLRIRGIDPRWKRRK